jgi:uncharacterized membrane protein YgcG
MSDNVDSSHYAGLPLGEPGVGTPGIDPSPDELLQIPNLETALAFAGITTNVWSAMEAQIGSATLLRQLVMVSHVLWDNCMSGAQMPRVPGTETTPEVPARPFTPMEMGAMVSLRRVARLRVGLRPGELDLRLAALAPGPPPTGGVSSGSGSVATPGVDSGSHVVLTLGQLVDQFSKTPLKPLDPAHVRKLFADYVTKYGALPADAAEPTGDQISAVAQILSADSPPYVDFAVWGPFGLRLLRKLFFVAFIPQGDNSFVRKELPGPPDFESWWASYRVFRSVALLLGFLDIEVADNYGEKIRDLSRDYPWFILYQADVRMRSERMEKLRRLAEQQHASGAMSSFDVARPWNTVFRAAVADTDYWAETVKEQSSLYHQRRISAADAVSDGTAQPIVTEGLQPSSKAPSLAGGGDTTGRKRLREPRGGPPSSGRHVHNRRGLQLCPDYNNTGCSFPCANSKAHQCEICLDTHPTFRHDQAKPSSSASHPSGGGGGKHGGGDKHDKSGGKYSGGGGKKWNR